jgi:hypothetical protein
VLATLVRHATPLSTGQNDCHQTGQDDCRCLDDAAASAVAIGVTVLGVLFVLFLWFFPRTVARTLLPEQDSTPIANSSPDAWFAVGCALLGLWVLTEAVPALVRNIYVLFYAQRARLPTPEGWDAGVVYYLGELAIGVWLLLGAAGARKLVGWARGAGTP